MENDFVCLLHSHDVEKIQHTNYSPLVPLYEPSSRIQCSNNNNNNNNNSLNKQLEPSSNLSNNENTENTCYICSDPIEIYSISECNHRTCHLCTLRTRILLDSDTCAYCRTQQNEVLLTRDSKRSFEELKSSSTNWITISEINVLCEDTSIFRTATHLMEFQCPSKNCSVVCIDWDKLTHHVRVVHNRVFCTMCIVNRKIFSSEHQLYTPQELISHYNGNNTTDSYFQGHPPCTECKIHFYDSTELYDHYLIHHKFVPNVNLLRPSQHNSHSHQHHNITTTGSQEHFDRHLIEASDVDISLLVMCIISGLVSVIGNITVPGCHDFERFFHSLENLFITLTSHDEVNQSLEIIFRNMASSLYMVGGRCLMLIMYLMIIFWVIKGWFFIMSWVIYGACIVTFGKICWENLSKSFISRN